MIYILANLDGDDINKTLTSTIINNNNLPCKELIIIGNIIETIEKNNKKQKRYKLSNLNTLKNIHYCLINETVNVKLLLGNKDLKIMNIYKYLEIDTSYDFNTGDSTIDYINNFNTGDSTIDEKTMKIFTNENKLIRWKYSLDDFYEEWSEEYKAIYNSNINDNLKDYQDDSKFMASIYTRFIYLFKFTLNAEFLLYSIPHEINNILSLTLVINYSSKLEKIGTNMKKWILSFIVLSIFRSLLNPTNYIANSYTPTFTYNSNFCKGWLYSLYLKESTSMILLYNDKYLLSNNRITKRCIDFFLDKEIQETQESTDSLLSLKEAVLLCNFAFKRMIKENYDNTNINVNVNKFIKNIYFNPIENDFFLIDESVIYYTSSHHIIIQIFIYNKFNCPNLFYKINNLNMLVYLNILNTLNCIYINEDNFLNSIVKLHLSPTLKTIPYDNIIQQELEESEELIYINKEYMLKYFGISFIFISNIVNINNLTYSKFESEFDILNTYFNKYNSSIKLIYNGFTVDDNNKIFFIFFIIKTKIKIYYILSENDIFELLENSILKTDSKLIKKYNDSKTNENTDLKNISLNLLKKIRNEKMKEQMLKEKITDYDIITYAIIKASNINIVFNNDKDDYSDFYIEKMKYNFDSDCNLEEPLNINKCKKIKQINELINSMHIQAKSYLSEEENFQNSRKDIFICKEFEKNEDTYNEECHFESNQSDYDCPVLKKYIDDINKACSVARTTLYNDTLEDRKQKAIDFNKIFETYRDTLILYNKELQAEIALNSIEFQKLNDSDDENLLFNKTLLLKENTLETKPSLEAKSLLKSDILLDGTLLLKENTLETKPSLESKLKPDMLDSLITLDSTSSMLYLDKPPLLDLKYLLDKNFESKLTKLESILNIKTINKYLKYKYKYLKLTKK